MKYNPLKLAILPVFLTAAGLLCSSFLQAEPSTPLESSTQPSGEYASFQQDGDIRRFIGETLYIDISFLWFENAASARIGLYEKNGVIYSTLEAETKGFIGFFTSYRKHFYKATFDVLDDGKRFRSRKFERRVIVGGQEDATSHSFDYDTHTHWWYREHNGKLVKSGSEDIPRGVNFDDILAVFYNFRNEVYGKVEKGARYTIHTVPEKGMAEIQLHILPPDEQNDFMSQEGRKNGEEFLLKAIIPKEIFQTKTGELLFWTSKHLIPLETTVKDYILFGDLHAKLNRRIFQLPKITSAAK
ncbi:MAG: DUF3108 domain-containing protein [Nitrospinae bacterium]|nr:DUF3108 domain-containing protein [Nitrospinota bacterium]